MTKYIRLKVNWIIFWCIFADLQSYL